uniref:Evasin n=1 Tax=Rhipicephalus appendiculatus TaxID=34631 RepID=A0A131YRC7_RHIAP
MTDVKFCLILIAAWTLYTHAKHSNSQGSPSRKLFFVRARSSLQETVEGEKHKTKPKKHEKHHGKHCGDGLGNLVGEGVACSFYQLDKTHDPTVPQRCKVGICRNGTCSDVRDEWCSNY